MNLEEYKKFMNVTEDATEDAEDGVLQVFELNRLNPKVIDWNGMKIAIDVYHDTLLIINRDNDIVNCFEDVFGITPEDDELEEYLEERKSLD